MILFSLIHPGFFRAENGRLGKKVMALSLLMLLTACTDKTQESAQRGDAFPLSILSKERNLKQQDIDLSNKKLLINFWATWCQPCREEMPFLQELSDNLDPREYAIIGVSIDDDSNLVKEFLLEYNIRYPNFLDENGEIASERLDIKVLPETLLISSRGIILNRITGKLSPKSSGLQDFISSPDTLSNYSRKVGLANRQL
jgi:thiol-disulfide isomerase/thioredoxin